MFSPLFFTSTHSITERENSQRSNRTFFINDWGRARTYKRREKKTEKGTRNHGELDNKTHCAPHNREHLLENNHQSCHHSLVRWPIFFSGWSDACRSECPANKKEEKKSSKNADRHTLTWNMTFQHSFHHIPFFLISPALAHCRALNICPRMTKAAQQNHVILKNLNSHRAKRRKEEKSQDGPEIALNEEREVALLAKAFKFE